MGMVLHTIGTTCWSLGLAELALDPPSSSADLAGPPHLDEEHLVLSTVHSAKGLEWDHVHVIGLSDGLFPSDMALVDEDGLEEERRLFYVAVTRARRRLHLHVPSRYHHHPLAQRGGQHLIEFHERGEGRRLDARCTLPRCGTKAQGDGHRRLARIVDAVALEHGRSCLARGWIVRRMMPGRS